MFLVLFFSSFSSLFTCLCVYALIALLLGWISFLVSCYIRDICCFHFIYNWCAICVSSQIDTKNILFICGGAFVDLEKTISERLHKSWKFNSSDINIMGSLVFLYVTSNFSFLFRRHDSSIGFGAPIRANMRTGKVTEAAVASSLLQTVSFMRQIL